MLRSSALPLCHTFWKEECVLKPACTCPKLAFVGVIRVQWSSVNGQKRLFWLLRVLYCVVYSENLLSIEQQSSITSEDMIDRSIFRVWKTVTGSYLNSIFWANSWLTGGAVFLNVWIVDHCFQRLSRTFLNWQLIISKFRFISVFIAVDIVF